MDSLGLFGRTRDFVTFGANTVVDEIRRGGGTNRGRTLSPDPRPEAGSFFRSDHFPLSKAGVPAVSFKPGEDLVKGGKEKAPRYAMNSRRRNITSQRTNGARLSTSPVWPMTSHCSMTSGAHSRTPRGGLNGRPAASSRHCATSQLSDGGELCPSAAHCFPPLRYSAVIS